MGVWDSILILGVLSGCVSDENFGSRYARAVCNQGLDCEAASFAHYEDEESCRVAVESLWDSTVEYAEFFGCRLEWDLAGDCLDTIGDATCEQVEASGWDVDGACAEMVVCDDVLFDTGA